MLIIDGGFCADPIVRFGELWGQLAKVGHLEQLAELAALGVRADSAPYKWPRGDRRLWTEAMST